MTGKPDVAEDRLRWAKAELGVAETETVHPSDIYRAITEEDFYPTEAQRQAIGVVLGNTKAKVWQNSAYLDACDQQNAEAINEFAAEFFELPPPERRERLTELKKRQTLFPVQKDRLRMLERGVDVDVKSFSGGIKGRLCFLIRDLFVLPRRDRLARERVELVRIRESGSGQSWSEAAIALGKDRMDVANLLPDFVDKVKRLSTTAIRKEAAKVQRLHEKAAKRYTRTVGAMQPGTNEKSGTATGLVIVLAIIFIAAMFSGRKKKNDIPDIKIPTFNSPEYESRETKQRDFDDVLREYLEKQKQERRKLSTDPGSTPKIQFYDYSKPPAKTRESKNRERSANP